MFHASPKNSPSQPLQGQESRKGAKEELDVKRAFILLIKFFSSNDRQVWENLQLNSSKYHHLPKKKKKNPLLNMKIEKHGISLLFITPPNVIQAHLWYLHGLITSLKHFLQCRSTPGLPLLLQDERTERAGWAGVTSQKDALHQRLPTHTRAALLSHIRKSRRTCSSSPQVRFCSRCGPCRCQQGFLMKLLSFAFFLLYPKKQQSHLQEVFVLRTRKRRGALRENYEELIPREFTLLANPWVAYRGKPFPP